jgi:hypothetical protein
MDRKLIPGPHSDRGFGHGLRDKRRSIVTSAATPRFGQAPLGFDAGDANLYRYVSNSPTGRIDPTGLADWDFKVQGVDLKKLKDLVVGYYFELKLTVPEVKNKLFIILSEDEKWGIGTEGKVSTLEPIYRVDVQGPLSTDVDKVNYTQLGQAGDWAVFVRKSTKTFGFLPLAKGLKWSGKSNVDVDQAKYLGLFVDVEAPKATVKYTYIYVNTRIFRQACLKNKQDQESLASLASDLSFLFGVDFSEDKVYEILSFRGKLAKYSRIEVTPLPDKK